MITRKSIGDGVKTVYLNAHGKNRDGIPEELMQFLDYVKTLGVKKQFQLWIHLSDIYRIRLIQLSRIVAWRKDICC